VLATALVPPNASMIAETVMKNGYNENRKLCNSNIPVSVIYRPEAFPQLGVVLTTKELLARLRERNVKNADIARALNISPSRVTDLFNSGRALKLDEAARLVAAFDLESLPSQRVAPLPGPVAELVVRHIAQELGRPLRDGSQELRELAEDLRAFHEFVSDPEVRESIDLAMAFFQALRLRRPTPVTVS